MEKLFFLACAQVSNILKFLPFKFHNKEHFIGWLLNQQVALGATFWWFMSLCYWFVALLLSKLRELSNNWSEMITSFGPLLLIAKSTVLRWFKFLFYQYRWQLTYSHFITKFLWHSPHFKPLKQLAGFIQDVPSFWGFKNNSKWKLLGRLFQMMSRLQKISEEYNVAVFITNQMTADPGASLSFQVSCWGA